MALLSACGSVFLVAAVLGVTSGDGSPQPETRWRSSPEASHSSLGLDFSIQSMASLRCLVAYETAITVDGGIDKVMLFRDGLLGPSLRCLSRGAMIEEKVHSLLESRTFEKRSDPSKLGVVS